MLSSRLCSFAGLLMFFLSLFIGEYGLYFKKLTPCSHFVTNTSVLHSLKRLGDVTLKKTLFSGKRILFNKLVECCCLIQ